jgi:hypothetical protein
LGSDRIRFVIPYETSSTTYSIYVKPRGRFYYKGEYVTNYNAGAGTFAPFVWSLTGTTSTGYNSVNLNVKLYTGGVSQDVTSTHLGMVDALGWGVQPYYSGSQNPSGQPQISNQNITWVPESWEYADVTPIIPYANSGKNITCSSLTANRLTVMSDLFVQRGNVIANGYKCRGGITNVYDNPNSRNNNSGTYFWYNESSVFNINWQGGYTYTSTPITLDFWIDSTKVYVVTPNFSDYRLKENIKPVSEVLDRLCTIDVIKYDFIQNGCIPASSNHVGLFAHDLQDKFPELNHLVIGQKDEVDCNEKPSYQTVTTELNYLLLKAVQELKQEIENLKLQIQLLSSR